MRNVLKAGLASGILVIAIAAPAQGATTIGQTFTPSTADTCAANQTVIQSQSAGFLHQAPTAGLITEWRYAAPASAVPQLKFKVFRLVNATDYTTIAQSSVQVPSAGNVTGFELSPAIPVNAGDMIGATYVTAGACKQASALAYRSFPSDTTPGNTDTYSLVSGQIDISASLELDHDGDGLGDDTQDQDDDNDGVDDGSDDCPAGVVGAGGDHDGDGCKNSEDSDDDNDTVADGSDVCPIGVTGPGNDPDADGCKNSEDIDDDNDTVLDGADNCSLVSNPDQANNDGDAEGDVCDADDDNDTVADAADACPTTAAATADGCPDKTAPVATITSGPKSKTKDTTPTFAFTSSEPGSTFRCKLDDGAEASCSSPFTSKKLRKGKHTFSVIATDAAGNASTAATQSFKVKKKKRRR